MLPARAFDNLFKFSLSASGGHFSAGEVLFSVFIKRYYGWPCAFRSFSFSSEMHLLYCTHEINIMNALQAHTHTLTDWNLNAFFRVRLTGRALALIAYSSRAHKTVTKHKVVECNRVGRTDINMISCARNCAQHNCAIHA